MIKKKNVFIFLTIILLLVVPIITIASIRQLEYDDSGRVIVSSAKELNELEPGTEFSLAIPSNSAVSKEEKNAQIAQEKQELQEKAATASEEHIAEIIQKQNEIKANDELNSNSIIEPNIELENKEQEFINIFIKYYGKEETTNLLKTLEEESTDSSGAYVFPKSSEIFFKKIIDLLKNENISNEEKETLIYIVDAIDLNYLDNKELKNELESIIHEAE